MEVLDKIVALAQEVLTLLTALGIPVGAIWGTVQYRKKKQGDAAPDAPEETVKIVQGTPVPAAVDQFEMKTLEYFIARCAVLERELEDAHDALQKANIPIPHTTK